MSLSDVEHQGYAQRLIQRAVASDRTPHAYIFHGPDGVGKELFARGMAQLLLCSSPMERALDGGAAASVGIEHLRVGCGTCEDCRTVAGEAHPDWHLVYRQLNREHPDPDVRKRKGIEIGIDVLRHFVVEKVGLTPVRGRAKVFVIREADRITAQAQNALLKTLEEPPGTTFIVLLVANLDRLLPTTLSRCQQIRFDPLPADFVRERLAALRPDVPAEHLDWYARFGEGSVGAALQAVDDELYALNQRIAGALSKLTSTRADALVKPWTKEAEALGAVCQKRDPDITTTESTRLGLKTIFKLAAGWYADALRAAHGATAGGVATQRLPGEVCAGAIGRLAQAERQLDLNAYAPLCLETLLNDLGELARGRQLVAG